MLKRYGSIEFAQARARELLDAAEAAFGQTFASAQEGEDKACLARSIRYITERKS